MVKTKIQCSCGQENQLVFLDDKWRYDITRHGNDEPCEGKCFNCHAPLKDDELFPAEAKETPEPAVEPEATEGPKEASMSMTKKELLAVAKDIGVEVPTGANKTQILGLIEECRQIEEQKPEDE